MEGNAAEERSPAAAAFGASVLPIVNKLQDMFLLLQNPRTLELPQVIAIGEQSSGKSSVLEAFIGRNFLPRGSDVCTRRPLLLQLVHQAQCDADQTRFEWGEFSHLPGEKFYDFHEIRREIQEETDRVAGPNKGVSDKQIHLKIYSPNVLNITLVDLPGFTKVAAGDQLSDFGERIRTLAMSYISHKPCIILAVSPANADLANSAALQIARIADPNGSRTIGVITKLDLIESGADACDLLLGKIIPLRHGYVGVVNCGQQDINANSNIRDALVYEEKFFQSQPFQAFRGVAHCCGIPQLAKKLNLILVQHIMHVLPEVHFLINRQSLSASEKHACLSSTTGLEAKIINIVSKYNEAFSSLVEGENEELSTAEHSGGARIHDIQSIFVKSLEVPFEVLVRKKIAPLIDPSLQCVRLIYDEITMMSERCLPTELNKLPVLRRKMDEVIGDFLREGLEAAEVMIAQLIDMEMECINTSHPLFIGGKKTFQKAHQLVKDAKALIISKQEEIHDAAFQAFVEAPYSLSNLVRVCKNNPTYGSPQDFPSIIQLRATAVDALEVAITKLQLQLYYEIVRRKIAHTVPRTVMHHLAEHMKRSLHSVLVTKLYREFVLEKRKEAKGLKEVNRVLQQAYSMLAAITLEIESFMNGATCKAAWRATTEFKD